MHGTGRLARNLMPALVAGVLLGGCAAPSRIGQVPATDPAARRAAIGAVGSWEARGRIALKTPGTSGQGNFAWLQTGDRTVLRVAGPFGAGAYEIRWEPARLTVLAGRGEVKADYTGPMAAGCWPPWSRTGGTSAMASTVCRARSPCRARWTCRALRAASGS